MKKNNFENVFCQKPICQYQKIGTIDHGVILKCLQLQDYNQKNTNKCCFILTVQYEYGVVPIHGLMPKELILTKVKHNLRN